MIIAYGRDTKSIEDWSQIVVLDIPDDVEDVEEYIENEAWDEKDVVLWNDVLDATTLALVSAGLSAESVVEILATIHDALVNYAR
jgi:hypothetical protein